MDEVVIGSEDLDRRRLSVDIHDVAQFETLVFLPIRRLLQFAMNALQVDGQAVHIDGRLGTSCGRQPQHQERREADSRDRHIS